MPTEENITNKNELDIKTHDDVDYIADITKLPLKVQRFVNLYMTGQYTLTKLAELLEVHPNTVSNWLRNQDVKDVIYDMQRVTQEAVGIQLKALQVKAVNRLNDLLESPIDGVAYQAVKDILDRGGHKPEQKINVNKTVVTYEEKLKNLIDNVIEVDYVDGDKDD
jgi:predicted HTH domain antitoxin